jgi:serine/threonine-protein kinase RsbW
MDEKQIKFTIESNLKNVFLIGLAVNKISSHIGLNELESYRLELCVVEAVNNAIIHAYDKEAGNKVEVVFNIYPDRLVLDVYDTGKPMQDNLLEQKDISSLEFEPGDLDSIPEGGRGIAIMKEIMDSMDYKTEDGKNCLTMTKKIVS